MNHEWNSHHKIVRMIGFVSTLAVGALLPALALAADIVIGGPRQPITSR
jgi:hypothetical protein